MRYWYKNIILIVVFVASTVLPQSTIQKEYVESNEIISNPERGFSVYRSSQITGAFINGLRSYNVTVIQRIYTIPQFINSALSDDFLNIVESDLFAAREGGIKLVLRFSYTDNQNGSDAPLNIIQQHIEQLKPIFQNNSDVILYLEAGFIGAWGEWYYSSNSLNNTADRKTVLFALLDAMPTERCVVVRTPNYKRQIFNDDVPINISDAFNLSNKSRTGAHNDCFLASSTDFGTYQINDIEGDKLYLSQDNMFVPQGGETCNPSQFSDCNIAPIDLSRMHWSVLNRDYHPTVLSSWKSEGCYDDVQRQLGYRFVLLNSEITSSVKPGGIINIGISIANKGYASPFNPRSLEFVLREESSKMEYRLISNEDPRYWFSGDLINIDISAGIIDDMPEGNYELLLHLADPKENLHDRVEYSIQLANQDVWEDSTGYNSLDVNVKINANVEGQDYNGEMYFSPDSSNTKGHSSIQIDGIFDDWESVSNLDVFPNEELIGDGLNPSVDLKDIWITDDEENIYLNYAVDGEFSDQYFYHLFFDTDNDTSTGFHTSGSYAGIDLMIENDLMWKYNGRNGEWGWEAYGTFSSAFGIDSLNRIEFSLSKNLLIDLGASNSIAILFNINNNDLLVEDDYYPNDYRQKSLVYSLLLTSLEVDDIGVVPNNYKITSYPNPFNNTVNFQFNVDKKDVKSLNIYDTLGRLVKTYETNNINSNIIQWDGKNNSGLSQSSGTYIIILTTNNRQLSDKIILLK